MPIKSRGFRWSRRALLAGAGLSLAVGGWASGARAQSSRAEALVRATAEQMVAIVNGPGSPADKKARMRQVIDAAVDVDGIGRFALGRFVRTATPVQMREYAALFHDVLLNNVTPKIGDYQGVAFTLGALQMRDDGEHVMTMVMRPNNPPANVAWVVGDVGGVPKIIDVIAEGTSMRLTQRSDYASYLARNGNDVQALVVAMRQQTAPVR